MLPLDICQEMKAAGAEQILRVGSFCYQVHDGVCGTEPSLCTTFETACFLSEHCYIKIHSLSELLEMCKELSPRYIDLVWNGRTWKASDVVINSHQYGDTPEIAVARLWLKLVKGE